VATVYELPAGGAAPREALSGGRRVPVREEAYALGPGEQGDFDSDVLRLGYSSLTTPPTTIDYNMATGSQCAPPKHTACHRLASWTASALNPCAGALAVPPDHEPSSIPSERL
jgi:hypothetical protein